MMTTTLRAALIFVSLGTCCLIMRKIRQSKMQIESAIFWIVLSLVLVVYSLFPQVADFCCNHKLFVSVCDFCFDCKGILYVCSYFSAGKPGKGAGSENCSG